MSSGKDECKDCDDDIIWEDVPKYEGMIIKYNLNSSFGNVSGLSGFDVYYSLDYDKVVYVLGEVHSKNNICNPSLNTAKDVFFKIINIGELENYNIDAFLEVGYDPKEYSDEKFPIYYKKFEKIDKGFMNDTLIELSKENCGINNKSRCKYKKTRFHSADIRSTTNVEVIEYLNNLIHYITYCFNLDIYTKKTCNNYLSLIKSYKGNRSIQILRIEIDNALKETKIIKQIENIPEKNKKAKLYIQKIYDEALKTYLPTLTKKLVDKLQEYYDKFGSYIPPNKRDYEEMRLIDNTSNFISTLMDMYLAGRIFREFRQVGGVYSKAPRNIIIYAGNFHALNYSKMFKDLGFINIFSGKKTDNSNCLDLSEFKQLMFLD